MNEIQEIQKWYGAQCNGDWEHQYGIEVESLDNPGWKVVIDLIETELEKSEFKKAGYGVGDDLRTSGNNWLLCQKVGDKFVGVGGPEKLTEILNAFLNWMETEKSHSFRLQ